MYIPSGERRTRPPPPPSQSNPKPYVISQSQPVPITNYRTFKPYRERNPNNNNTTPLPIVTHTHSNRKPRPALYEPRYQPEKHYPYVPVQHTSLVTEFPLFSSPILLHLSLSLPRNDILLIHVHLYGIVDIKVMMNKRMINEHPRRNTFINPSERVHHGFLFGKRTNYFFFFTLVFI